MPRDFRSGRDRRRHDRDDRRRDGGAESRRPGRSYDRPGTGDRRRREKAARGPSRMARQKRHEGLPTAPAERDCPRLLRRSGLL